MRYLTEPRSGQDHHGLDSLDYAAAVSVEHELRSMSHEKLVQLLLQVGYKVRYGAATVP